MGSILGTGPPERQGGCRRRRTRPRTKGWFWAWLAAAIGLQASAATGQSPSEHFLGSSDIEQTETLYQRALREVAAGAWEDARRSLQQLLAQSPHHAGAWLDLAQLYCQFGDERRARELWQEVEERFDPPAGIRDLISYQRSQGCAPQGRPLGTRGEIRLGHGYSSNVNQGVRQLEVELAGPGGPWAVQLLPEYARRADQYTDIAGDWRVALTPAGGEGFVQARLRQLSAATELNSQELLTGYLQAWRADQWRGSWQVTAGSVRLGGKLYQRQTHWTLLARPASNHGLSFSLHGTALSFPSLQGFDSKVWEARVSWEPNPGRWTDHKWQFYASALRDEALGKRPGGHRQGWQLSGVGRSTLLTGLGWLGSPLADWSLQVQHWKSQDVYSPGLVEQVRQQNLVQASVSLVWPQAAEADWVLEARRVRNYENIKLFAHDISTVHLGWRKRWGGRP